MTESACLTKRLKSWDLALLHAKGYEPEIVGYEEYWGAEASWIVRWIVRYPYKTKCQAAVDRLLGEDE